MFPSFAPRMETMETDIIGKAKEMFHRYGLRPVTMDDIAKELSVSKKTLYKYFSNKEELVEKSVEQIFETVSGRMRELLNFRGNAIDMLFAMDEVICSNIEDHDPGLQFQLERYYPELHAKLENQKQKMVYLMMHHNIKQGKEEGLFRPELNADVVAFLYYSRARLMTESDMSHLQGQNLSTSSLMREILIYHVRGIANEKGLAYLAQKIKSWKTNTKKWKSTFCLEPC